MTITWGANRPNANPQQQTSLGAVATGNVHTFTRFRMTGGSGASLHPLQRTGAVSADSHAMGVRMTASGPPGLGSGASVPVPYVVDVFPPVVPMVIEGTLAVSKVMFMTLRPESTVTVV